MAFVEFVHLRDHGESLEVAAGLEVLLERTNDAISSTQSFACSQGGEWTVQQVTNAGNKVSSGDVSRGSAWPFFLIRRAYLQLASIAGSS